MIRVILTQLTEWYEALDMIDRANVDTMLEEKRYLECVTRYETAPNFPTWETVKHAEKG